MAVKICEHIKASGFRCGSPAAKGERLCYFHKSLGQALPIRSVLFDPCLDQQSEQQGPRILMMPLLEDAASVQMATCRCWAPSSTTKLTRARDGRCCRPCTVRRAI